MCTIQPPIPRATLARSRRVLLLTSAAVVTVAAWLWLRHVASSEVHSVLLAPHRHHLDALSFLYVVIMWQAMMIAMMTPTVLPWLLAFATLTVSNGDRNGWLHRVAAFAGGYFVVWLGYSLIAASIQIALQHYGLLRLHGKVAAVAAGIVLIAAGLFQFAPVKRACLTHCRNPLTYLLSRWRNGPLGGFRLGIVHGAFCVACCWFLMMTSFSVGVMNMAWMAILTVLVAVEQLAPHGDRISGALGLVMAAWGIVLLR
jgi:predicted metal-binding membrane protein